MVETAVASKVRVQSAARAIAILLTVSHSPNGLRGKEIREILGLPTQVSYHLIHTLVSTGTLRRNEEGRYVLGLAAGSIADGFGRQLGPAERLAPRLRSIVAATGETAYASGWVDGDVVALTAVRGTAPIHVAEVPSGYRQHGHARATGKLLLAFTDPERRESYLARNPLVRLASKTIISRDRLESEFEQIRQRGYALDDEEFADGLRCLALPVEGTGNSLALCLSAPKERFEARLDFYLAVLNDAVRLDLDNSERD